MPKTSHDPHWAHSAEPPTLEQNRNGISGHDAQGGQLCAQADTPLLTLEQLFREYAEHRWIFVPPGGNWGDSLIYQGAEHLAKRLGLRSRTVSFEEFARCEVSPEECIYIHGGGGLNSWCSGAPFRLFKDATSRKCAAVILGPQTCEETNQKPVELLRSAIAAHRTDRVIVFARELTSLQTLGQLSGSGAEVGVDHDTALQLDAEALLEIAGLTHLPTGRYPLVVVRTDTERTLNAASTTRIRGVQIDTAFEATSFQHWIRLHLYAKSIHTDRLHSAIIGALLGKPVTLYQGAYHKNRSLWEFSLKSRGVQWGSGTLVAGDAFSCLPSTVQSSHKMRSLRKLLWGVPAR